MPTSVKNAKTLFVALIAIITVSTSFSQSRQDYKQIADRAFEAGNYIQTATYYEMLIEEKPDTNLSIFPYGNSYRGESIVSLEDIQLGALKIATCYKNVYDYENFQYWAGRASAVNEPALPEASLMYAQALQLNGNYGRSIEEFNNVLKNIGTSSFIADEAKFGIKCCKFAIEYLKNPDRAQSYLMANVNENGSSYAPVLIEKGMTLSYTTSKVDLIDVNDLTTNDFNEDLPITVDTTEERSKGFFSNKNKTKSSKRSTDSLNRNNLINSDNSVELEETGEKSFLKRTKSEEPKEVDSTKTSKSLKQIIDEGKVKEEETTAPMIDELMVKTEVEIEEVSPLSALDTMSAEVVKKNEDALKKIEKKRKKSALSPEEEDKYRSLLEIMERITPEEEKAINDSLKNAAKSKVKGPTPPKGKEAEYAESLINRIATLDVSTVPPGFNLVLDFEVDNKFNVSSATFSSDMSFAIMTIWRGGTKTGKYNLYKSVNENNVWKNPVKIEGVNQKDIRTMMPYLYQKENKLFFVSDREGGEGGLDIWVVDVNESGDIVGEPKNLGKTINTKRDDVTPFYDTLTSNLYFSSNGHVGMGGLDIFSSEGKTGSWDKPINLGYPTNSSYQDAYFTKGVDYLKGYFASDRQDTCSTCLGGPSCYKIYDYTAPQLAVDGVVADIDTKELLIGAKLSLYDTTNKEDELISVETNDAGEYLLELEEGMNYNITARNSGYQDNTSFISTVGMKPTGTINFDTIFFYKLIPLTGRVTDNDDLLPISSTKITLIDCEKKKIVGSTFTDSEGYFKYAYDRSIKYRIVAEKYSYLTDESQVTFSMIFDPKKAPNTDIKLTKIILNKSIVIPNVLYEFNSSVLRESTKIIMDSMVRLLTNNPQYVIQISSHTDTKGSDLYNLKLSQKRAKSVTDYMVKKGINKNLLEVVGYGESRPIAPNVLPNGDDNLEGRALNRRTEFSIKRVIRISVEANRIKLDRPCD
ncbi:MAG: outer membrane protein OmpA-like peptidoglycan-associated protein [Sphingobacteriales bacterium]|jgi:outer membrane protein OmpA-like peptidoglycan-associated protein/tetratricopeptide (TPR) repeat protein